MDACVVSEAYVPRRSNQRDPWTADEAREALASASRSGLSLAAFARRHGLSDRQLYWWHMRLRTHPDVAAGRLSFVPVVQARAPVAAASSGVEFTVGAAVVRVERDFCEQTLARTVAVLRSLSC